MGKPTGPRAVLLSWGWSSVLSHTRTTLLRVVVPALVALLATAVALPAQGRTFEAYGTFQPQVSCDPVAKTGVLAFRALVLRRFGGGDLGIVRGCDVGATSEHKEGRAWDHALEWSKPADRARARRVIEWLTEPVAGDPARRANRLGVMYLIWNKRIWSSGSWREYTGESPHRDHIHFSFTWNGATQRTSWWTGQVMPYDYGPCRRWIGEYAPRWKEPRTTPCPEAIHRPEADRDGYYLAQSGETLRRVARFFDLTTLEVRIWNGLPREGRIVLYVGQRIRVVEPAVIPPVTQPGTQPPEPTPDPTSEPTADPTSEPTADPTSEPTADPTSEPTAEPAPASEG